MSARLDNRPIATHLSTEQVDRFRRLLAEVYSDRQARAAELENQVDLEPGLADVLRARCCEAMDEINAALARIGDGSYGICINCGAPISFERLEVVPAADLCVACQALRDRVICWLHGSGGARTVETWSPYLRKGGGSKSGRFVLEWSRGHRSRTARAAS